MRHPTRWARPSKRELPNLNTGRDFQMLHQDFLLNFYFIFNKIVTDELFFVSKLIFYFFVIILLHSTFPLNCRCLLCLPSIVNQTHQHIHLFKVGNYYHWLFPYSYPKTISELIKTFCCSVVGLFMRKFSNFLQTSLVP